MFMLLDQGPTPLYYQLKTILEAKIRSQEYKEKERFPSEGELCKQFNISRITVRQALSELQKAGLVYRERGKGTFVTEGAEMKRPVLKGSIEDVIAAAKGTKIKILSYREIETPNEISDNPRVARPGRVFRLEMIRLIPQGPQGYSVVYFPLALGKIISRDEINEDTEIITFVEDKLATKTNNADQTIGVETANHLLAKHLAVKFDTPLLTIRRDYYTRTGSLMFIGISHFRPDRFKYEIELTRT
jgi:GntR family transcriptional regulator